MSPDPSEPPHTSREGASSDPQQRQSSSTALPSTTESSSEPPAQTPSSQSSPPSPQQQQHNHQQHLTIPLTSLEERPNSTMTAADQAEEEEGEERGGSVRLSSARESADAGRALDALLDQGFAAALGSGDADVGIGGALGGGEGESDPMDAEARENEGDGLTIITEGEDETSRRETVNPAGRFIHMPNGFDPVLAGLPPGNYTRRQIPLFPVPGSSRTLSADMRPLLVYARRREGGGGDGGARGSTQDRPTAAPSSPSSSDPQATATFQPSSTSTNPSEPSDLAYPPPASSSAAASTAAADARQRFLQTLSSQLGIDLQHFFPRPGTSSSTASSSDLGPSSAPAPSVTTVNDQASSSSHPSSIDPTLSSSSSSAPSQSDQPASPSTNPFTSLAGLLGLGFEQFQRQMQTAMEQGMAADDAAANEGGSSSSESNPPSGGNALPPSALEDFFRQIAQGIRNAAASPSPSSFNDLANPDSQPNANLADPTNPSNSSGPSNPSGSRPRPGSHPSFPIIITLSFGPSPNLADDHTPDPARAAELIASLDQPERGLVERLDRGLRLEEETRTNGETDGGEEGGARCGVCFEGLLDYVREAEESEEAKGKDGEDGKAERGGEESGDRMEEDNDGEGEKIRALPCSHAFHQGCLRPWLASHTSCPTCRFDLDPLSTTHRLNRPNSSTVPTRSNTPSSAAAPNANPNAPMTSNNLDPSSTSSSFSSALNPTSASGSGTSTPRAQAHPYARPVSAASAVRTASPLGTPGGGASTAFPIGGAGDGGEQGEGGEEGQGAGPGMAAILPMLLPMELFSGGIPFAVFGGGGGMGGGMGGEAPAPTGSPQPNHQQQEGEQQTSSQPPQIPAQSQDQAQSAPAPSSSFASSSAPSSVQANPQSIPTRSMPTFLPFPPGFHLHPSPNPHPSSNNPSTQSRPQTSAAPRVYTPPLPRLTLLDRVLALETTHHLRCSLPTCELAPTSENPKGFGIEIERGMGKRRMVSLIKGVEEIRAAQKEEGGGGDEGETGFVLESCEHRFHSGCLNLGVRVQGIPTESLEDGSKIAMACPIRKCQGYGWVSRADWEEGPLNKDEEAKASGASGEMLVDDTASVVSSTVVGTESDVEKDDKAMKLDLD